jgi:hypothetical protein
MALPKILLIVSALIMHSRVCVISTLPLSCSSSAHHCSFFLAFPSALPLFSLDVSLALPVLASCRERRYAHS